MGCVLRVSGRRFPAREFAKRTTLPVCSVQVLGEPRFPASQPRGRKWLRSGVNVTVSDAEFSDLKRQVRDAIRFLAKHARTLRRIADRPDVEDLTLDFAIQRRDVAAQFDHFPHALLLAAGKLRISLEVSSY